MIVHLKGLAATGPGFADLAAINQHFNGDAPLDPAFIPRPQGSILPGVERRRASPTVKLAVDVAQAAVQQSGLAAEQLAVVFASSNGDTNTIHQICEALATPERFVSPTRFHNSVHNAPAGYWSIASGSMQPSSSLCAWNDTFAAAFLEAATQCVAEQVPVLLAVFDTPFPDPLRELTPGHQPFGVALVLETSPQQSLASLDVSVEVGNGLPATTMTDVDLEALRGDSSAARSLPLLAACNTAAGGEVVLDYTEDLRLRIAVTHS